MLTNWLENTMFSCQWLEKLFLKSVAFALVILIFKAKKSHLYIHSHFLWVSDSNFIDDSKFLTIFSNIQDLLEDVKPGDRLQGGYLSIKYIFKIVLHTNYFFKTFLSLYFN